MRSPAMTRAQSLVYDFIVRWTQEHGGVVPTFQSIADGLGYASLATVHKHVQNLRVKGHLRWMPKRSAFALIPKVCPTCGRAA